MLKPVCRVSVLFFLFSFIFAFMVQPAQSASRRVWRIGNFDKSSEEFEGEAAGPDSGNPKSAPVFRVGKDDWRRQWAALHSGSIEGKRASRTILFSLKRPPLGTFTLKISTLHPKPRPSSYLRVAVNGRWGRFYFRPQSENPSKISASAPHGSPDAPKPNSLLTDTLLIDLPSGYFRLGGNRLELTVVIESTGEILASLPSSAESKQNSKGRVSGIFYDALELTRDPARPFRAAAIRARVAPTAVFKCRSGERVGLVAVVVRLHRRTRVGKVQLLVDGHWYKKDFPVDADFGERRVELEVPAWPARENEGEVEARLRVEISGPAKVFPVRLRVKRK